MANFAAQINANVNMEIYIKNGASPYSSITSKAKYQSVAFTVPSDTYRLKTGGVLQQYGSSPNISTDFEMSAKGLAIFSNVKTAQNYTVSIGTLTGGSITAAPAATTVGETVNLTIVPNAGMQLKAGTLKYNNGTDHEITGTSFTMPAANVTVKAEFEAIIYTVSIGTLTGGSITAAPTATTFGETVNLTIVPNTGMRLKAGTLRYNNGAEHEITGTSFMMPAANVTVEAEFEAIVYTVSIGALTGGSITATPTATTFGETVNLTIVPDTGMRMKAGMLRYNDGTEHEITGTSFTMPAANVTVEAEFEAITHSVTVTASPLMGGSADGGGTYNEGETVTVTAAPNSGYGFVDWTAGDTELSAEAVFTFTLGLSDMNLTANFAELSPDTGTIEGMVTDGTNPLPGADVYATAGESTYPTVTMEDGSYAILNVPAGTGYTVTAVKQGYTSGSAGNVSVAANTTASGIDIILTAIQPETYNVSVIANPAEGGTAEGGGVYGIGEPVTVTATSNGGYSFVNWTEDGIEVSTGAAFTFTMGSADRTLAANFILNPPSRNNAPSGKEPMPVLSVTTGASISFTASDIAQDADGDALSILAIIAAPDPATASAALSGGTVTVTGIAAGNTSVTVIVSDGKDEANVAVPVTVIGSQLPVYALSVTADEGGSITAGASGYYEEGAVIEIAAAPFTGYSFTKWISSGGGSFGDANAASTGFTMPANAVTVTAAFIYKDSGGRESGQPVPKPTYKAVVSRAGTSEITVPVVVDKASAGAAVDLENLTGKLFTDRETTVITVPTVPGADSYTLRIPAVSLSGSPGEGSLIFSTQAGSITMSDNMLSDISGAQGKKAEITIGQGDKTVLADEVKTAIGERPLICLTLALSGEQVGWKNPGSPVRVSVPYTPTTAELNDPEHIVIWYIDGSGNAVPVPSGSYDPAAGTVTFSTTHFSNYAVAYVHKTFSDLGNTEWARKPVGVMASKGIVNGTSADTYSPSAEITRGDYLVMLVRTLGLTADFDHNFDDVPPQAYYYEAAGIAGKLGIAVGGENGLLRPGEKIVRQDMMVLAARALKLSGRHKTAADKAVLDKFGDRGEVAGYAMESLAFLAGEDLITGSGDRLKPRSHATRAEAAVFLYRIYSKYHSLDERSH